MLGNDHAPVVNDNLPRARIERIWCGPTLIWVTQAGPTVLQVP